jgi:soluble lytic murein transglycosylase
MTVVELWKRADLRPENLGIDAATFATRRINDRLWASRYRNLVGDVEHAKIFAQDALDLISEAYVNLPSITTANLEQLSDLRAEAYHVLAYNIAVESKEYESALALTTLALQAPDLKKEWRERFQWTGGLYEYLASNFDGARRRWESLLNETNDEDMKARLYFWLSRAYEKLAQTDESRFYRRALVEEFPLSFYSIVGTVKEMTKEEDDGEAPWRKTFESPGKLREALGNTDDLDLSPLRSDKDLAPLLTRAEILAAAHNEHFGALAVSELEDAMQKSLAMENSVPAYLYVSRLHFAVQNYARSLSLTYQLSKSNQQQFWSRYPEQLLVNFPRPFADIYARKAIDVGLVPEMLYAVTRQESRFDTQAKSPANAFGLMQLIPPTAKRVAAEANLTLAHPEQDLLRPEVNIALGGKYLSSLDRRYKGSRPAVFAAYNAGEYAVDRWLEKRGQSDPLVWVELIPYGESKSYVQAVWRNLYIYKFLGLGSGRVGESKNMKDGTRPHGDWRS